MDAEFSESATYKDPSPDLNEVEAHAQMLQRRLSEAEKSAAHFSEELAKSRVIIASCRSGLGAIKEEQNRPQQSEGNGAY